MKKCLLAFFLFCFLWVFSAHGAGADDFVIKIDTTKVPSTNTVFELPLSASKQYSFSVDWWDGNHNSYAGWGVPSLGAKHTYAAPGTYTVRITENGQGGFPHFNARYYPLVGGFPMESKKLISIEQWWTIHWESMNSAFLGAENLVLNATDVPNLSQVSDFSQMFRRNFNLVDTHWKMAHWDMSHATNLSFMFQLARKFNTDISSRNTANVTNMSNLFDNAGLFNQPIGTWNVEKVENMNEMLPYTAAFNQNLGAWNPKSLVSATSFFNSSSAISRENYDALLKGRSTKTVKSWTNFTVGGQKYCLGATARDTLIQKWWTISWDWTNCAGAWGDTVAPVFNVADDVSSTATGTDNVQITVTDANPEPNSYKYAIRSNATCDSSVPDAEFTESFVSWTPIVFNTMDHNTKYLCFYAHDQAKNKAYHWLANPINIDKIGPVFTPAVANDIVSRKGTAITLTDVTAADGVGESWLSGVVEMNTWEINLDPNAPVSGDYVLVYTARDHAGNVSTLNRNIQITDADQLSGEVQRVTPALLNGKTAASVQAVNTAKANADTVYNNPHATQLQIDQAKQALATAIANLQTQPSAPASTSSSSRGGGGARLIMDHCPNGDYSPSYYDRSCGIAPTDTNQQPQLVQNNNGDAQGITNPEILSAYEWALKNGITTQSPIVNARLLDPITRAELAKMLSVFTQKYTEKKVVVGKVGCDAYQDLSETNAELVGYIKTACELEIMWLQSDGKTPLEKFMPDQRVSRAELVTVLSRILYGNQYDNWSSERWWEWHMKKLSEDQIVKDTTPTIQEIRARVLLMLFRMHWNI